MLKPCLTLILIFICLSVFPQAPVISSFSPSGGPAGTLVTVKGFNLKNPKAFTIGGMTAIVISDDGATLVGMVMPGAETRTISVTTDGGTAASKGVFSVSTPGADTLQKTKLFGTGSVSAQVAATANSGSGVGPFVYQGCSVAVSADGNTAIEGGSEDNNNTGAAWIFARSGGTWIQQGPKLAGTGAAGATVSQGTSVAISADGNTAIVGGYADNNYTGAAWVYTRSGGIWTQQGPKLVGTGAVGKYQYQGSSVSLSADGNTALIGAIGDDTFVGAAWAFTRTGGIWRQQGPKLTGKGAVGDAQQGCAVALSADGNTAIVGGTHDNYDTGAAWIYTRADGVWTQQGPKLAGKGAEGPAWQGHSVALSADGKTALVSGPYDRGLAGATWVYIRNGETWVQQGPKLVPKDRAGLTEWTGSAVSLSADGNTALVVGINYIGADTFVTMAFLYYRLGGAWIKRDGKLICGSGLSGPFVDDICPAALSADGRTAILGGPFENGSAGLAWIYTRCAGDK